MLEHSPRFIQEAATCVGKRNLCPLSFEQPDAKFRFQVLNVPADGRLGDLKALGSFGKAQLFGHSDEGIKMPKFHESPVGSLD
jgi:hypothetical protein